MWRVNPQSESKVCCGPSHSIKFDDGVFAFDLCPPGMMCKLDCPWLSPYLCVSLGKWLITSREQLVLVDIRGYCWEPGWTHSTVGFPQDYTPAMYQDFVPEFTPELINHPSDLVNRFGLMCVFSGANVSSLCVPLVLFDRALSQPVLSDLGILVAAGVHSDVSGPVVYPRGDSVRAGPHLLVSGDTSDGDRLPVTWLRACWQVGSCVVVGCNSWHGGGACGSSNQHASVHRRAQSWRLGEMYLDCVHLTGISCWSPACHWCLVIVCFLSCRRSLTVTKSLPGSLCQPVDSVGYQRSSCWLCTVTVYITGGMMASGDAGGSRPRVDRSGRHIRCELQTSWNSPESYVNLESPGVVELDTSVVPDVLGLRALYDDGKLIWVLGFPLRDASGYDQSDRSGSLNGGYVWPVATLAPISVDGMTRWQTDLELMRRKCKSQFSSLLILWTTHCE